MPIKKTVAKKTSPKKPVLKKVAVKNSNSKQKPLAKKNTTKKITSKKTVAKTKKTAVTKKPIQDLQYASDEQSFWVSNGEILNSLRALHAALESMPSDVFEFHTTGEQNDFVMWVETVLGDDACAADLHKAKTAKSAKTTIEKHLKRYAS